MENILKKAEKFPYGDLTKLDENRKRIHLTSETLTPERVDFITKNYLYLSDHALAELLGYKDGVTVRKVRQYLGLKRNRRSYSKIEADIPLIIWKMKEK